MNVTIYSKYDCPHCTAAKVLLSNRGITFSEQVLDIHFTRQTLTETYPSAKSFPVIVVDGFYIGGYTQLESMVNRNNSTQQLLNEVITL
jgi:glutaredoxin 3